MICDLCKLNIDDKKERYVHVEDWKEGKLVRGIWCHLSCFRKSMNKEKNDFNKQAKGILFRANEMLNRISKHLPEKEEEYNLC